jgi:hypothetical protein
MAVTVNYEYPIVVAVPPGVAPTALQVHDSVIAAVIATANGDTDAVITHNFGLTGPGVGSQLNAGQPEVLLIPLLPVAIVASWIVSARAANTITVTKLGVGGTSDAAVQLRVHIKRPHSIGR